MIFYYGLVQATSPYFPVLQLHLLKIKHVILKALKWHQKIFAIIQTLITKKD